jgi:hypothetical protein
MRRRSTLRSDAYAVVRSFWDEEAANLQSEGLDLLRHQQGPLIKNALRVRIWISPRK